MLEVENGVMLVQDNEVLLRFPLAEKEQAMMTLRDIKANLGERLSKIKWQQDQLRLEKDNLTLELTFHQYFAATR